MDKGFVVPLRNGSRWIKTNKGLWVVDHPDQDRLMPVRCEGGYVDQLMTADGYPTAAQCATGNPASSRAAGLIVAPGPMVVLAQKIG